MVMTFYLCVDVAEFLLSRSVEKKKRSELSLSLDAFILAVYLEQKTVFLARSGPTQASDITKVHPWGISHLGFNPQSESPVSTTYPITTLILSFDLRKSIFELILNR